MESDNVTAERSEAAVPHGWRGAESSGEDSSTREDPRERPSEAREFYAGGPVEEGVLGGGGVLPLRDPLGQMWTAFG